MCELKEAAGRLWGAAREALADIRLKGLHKPTSNVDLRHTAERLEAATTGTALVLDRYGVKAVGLDAHDGGGRLMRIKPLQWERTSLCNVESNGRLMTTETWAARNAFAAYKVYSAVSGRCFVILSERDTSGLPGFHADSLLGSPKTPCASIEDGKRVAEAHWRRKLETVLTV